MSRSKWKGPYVKKSVLINNNKLKFKDRKFVILPKFIGSNLNIYNGKKFSKLLVLEEMVGHKVGELVMTRKSFTFKKKKK